MMPPNEKDPKQTRALRITDNGPTGQTETLDGQLVVEVAWRSDGKYGLEHKFGQPNGLVCDWQPDIRELAFPLEVGQWMYRSTCEPFEGVSIERSATSEITGAAQVIIGGQDTIVWVVRTVANIKFKSGTGTTEQKEVSKSLFSPKYGLMVRSTQRRTGHDPSTRKQIDQTITLELTSLDPS